MNDFKYCVTLKIIYGAPKIVLGKVNKILLSEYIGLSKIDAINITARYFKSYLDNNGSPANGKELIMFRYIHLENEDENQRDKYILIDKIWSSKELKKLINLT